MIDALGGAIGQPQGKVIDGLVNQARLNTEPISEGAAVAQVQAGVVDVHGDTQGKIRRQRVADRRRPDGIRS